jgi:hypothetical protein
MMDLVLQMMEILLLIFCWKKRASTTKLWTSEFVQSSLLCFVVREVAILYCLFILE